MKRYICHSLIGSIVLFVFMTVIFLVCAFLLWDSHVLLKFWDISFTVFRGCVVASFLINVIDFAED